MANMKIVSLIDSEFHRARQQSIDDLENVQTQIILKINEVLAICDVLRRDVDGLMGRGEARH